MNTKNQMCPARLMPRDTSRRTSPPLQSTLLRLLCVGFAYGLALGAALAAEPEPGVCELEGEYEYVLYQGTNSEILDKRPFRVAVSGESWQITCFQSEGTNKSSLEQCVGSQGDGQVYFVHRMRSEHLGEFTHASVSSNTLPVRMPRSAIPHLWLMLASGSMLDQRTNLHLPMLFEPQSKFGDYPVEDATVRWHSAFPFLPERLAYIYDGFRHSVDTNNRPYTYQLPTPCVPGAIHARYTASDFKNVNGSAFPTRIEHLQYEPGDDDSGKPKLKLRRKLDVSIRAMRTTLTIQGFSPKLPRDTMFVDWRMERASTPIPIIQYPVGEGGKLPSVGYSMEMYKAAGRRTPTPSR
jgi:hypothetical protein